MAGLCLAHLLQQQTPFRIALIGDKAPDTQIESNRVCAFNQVSLALFAYTGLADFIQEARHGHYQNLAIYLDQMNQHTVHFSAEAYGWPRLGCIAANTAVEAAWSQRLLESDQVTHYHSTRSTGWRYVDGQHQLTGIQGEPITAQVLIGADGQRSWVREQLGIPIDGGSYGQSAIVATLETERPHEYTARQIFFPTGPLALLPLGDPHRVSIVWSSQQAVAEAYMQESNADFSARLTQAISSRYGAVRLQDQRHTFPLGYQHARYYARHHAAIIGDAAHTAHPLAGQGVNMSFLDAAVLADQLALAAEGKQDISAALRRYQMIRRSENSAWIMAMGQLHRSFTTSSSMTRCVLGIGMDGLEQIRSGKRALARYALGRPQDLPARIRNHLLGWMPQ
jgi:2-octaprenylphenol hydroxylase